MKNRDIADCGRVMDEKDTHLRDLDLAAADQAILQIVRLYMQSVSHPASMAWMAALANADDTFGGAYGPQIASRTLAVLQRVRQSRRSLFCFNSPTCPSCCRVVTEHERRFIVALKCARDGQVGQANMELMMLCEGNDIVPVRDAMEGLNTLVTEFLQSNIQLPQKPDSIFQRMM